VQSTALAYNRHANEAKAKRIAALAGVAPTKNLPSAQELCGRPNLPAFETRLSCRRYSATPSTSPVRMRTA
jgi:hypothetical protein